MTQQRESRPAQGNGEQAWYVRVWGTKKPSRRWREAIDDVVDGVDYGESPLPIERNDTWFGSIIGWAGGIHEEAAVLSEVHAAAQILFRDEDTLLPKG